MIHNNDRLTMHIFPTYCLNKSQIDMKNNKDSDSPISGTSSTPSLEPKTKAMI